MQVIKIDTHQQAECPPPSALQEELDLAQGIMQRHHKALSVLAK